MTTRNHWVHELAVQRGISVKTVEQTLKGATGIIVESTLDHVRGMRDESLRLFLAGETLAAMWAGQAMWEAAASVAHFVHDQVPLFRDSRTMEQRKAAGFSSGVERSANRKPEWDKWQEAVDAARVENPELSKTRIFEIAAAKCNVTRPAIAKRVVWR